MKIIIAGCGKVGYNLAEQLNEEGHELTIIDRREEVVTSVGESLDVKVIQGNVVSYAAQQEAGADEADLLIAMTGQDEVNLLCCLIARKAGCQTIARVRNPEYYYEIDSIKDDLKLTLAVNPELSTASNIARLIKYPSAMEVDTFAKGRADMVKFRLPEGSPWANVRISEASRKFGGNVLICIVEREGSKTVLIPDGNVILRERDLVSVIVTPNRMKTLFQAIGLKNDRLIRTVLIAGGGTLAYYLARHLLALKMQVKIIEKNRERCEELSELLPKAMIVHGDATNTELLESEALDQADAFVALTGVDEVNVLLSYYVSNITQAKVITKINRISYGGLIDNFEIGSLVSPKNVTAEMIIKHVRGMQNSRGSEVEAVYKMMDNRVEALEFYVTKESRVLNVPFSKLKTKDNTLIASIIRGGHVIIPSGGDAIKDRDTVIVVTAHKGLNNIEDILA